MSTENIYLAGRYNKYMRNLSQSPWIDKDDVRIKESVKELIEDGLKQHLKCAKFVFSSSGREDVDVRMLGRGRPFSFRIIEPWDCDDYNDETMRKIQSFINLKHEGKIHIRDLQIVSKESVAKYLKEGEDSKTKQYRALCCCSRVLTTEDVDKIESLGGLDIDQRTPIRVLHRRTISSRRRRIQRIKVNQDRALLDEFNSGLLTDCSDEEKDRLFVLDLLTEAGTYIKEFVHGDFGRTKPNLSSLLTNCDTDLVELDVMEVNLDWPPSVSEQTSGTTINQLSNQVKIENDAQSLGSCEADYAEKSSKRLCTDIKPSTL